MTRNSLGGRVAGSRCPRGLFAPLIFAALLAVSPAIFAAETLLFENLQAFGTRYKAGDPERQPTNSYGRILDGPKDIGVKDLDGDGFADFAVANKDGTVTVYFGLGGAQFGAPVHLPTSGTELRGIALADLTGDGKPDIAVGAPYQGQIYLLVNEGSRTFSLSNIVAWVGARDLAAGDFDGDGLNDLAVAGTTNGVSHFHNLGGGIFEVKTNIALIGTPDVDDFPQPAFYLKSFRVPGATKDEVAVARAQRNKVYVLATDADGALAVQNTLTNVGVNALDVGNLLHAATNPAAPDLIVSHNDRGTLEIHPGVANTTRFSQTTNQLISIPGGPRNVRIVDLDGDGWNDLVVVQQLRSQVLTYRNLAGVFIPTSLAWVGARPREMDLGDFNNDGHPDVAVLNRYSSDVSILTSYPGAVGFTAPDAFYPVDGEVSGLEVRDFNDDGQDDVIQLHRASGEMSVRLSETNGLLGEPAFYGLGLRPMGKVVVDVNGDDIPDVVTADMTPYITVRLGVGTGVFGPPQTFGLPDPVPTSGLMQGMSLPSAQNAQLFSVEAADFDGDGNVDVTVGFWDCRLGFYKGHGDGTFAFTHAHVLFSEPRAMTAGDFDQDGDLDIVCASVYAKIAIIANVGDLLTTTNLPKTIVDTEFGSVSAIKSLDSNGDIDPDLLIVGNGGARLYFGGPGLTFLPSTNTVTLPGVDASSVATADFNGDGYTDVASAGTEIGSVSIMLGSSNGVYTPLLTATVPSSRYLAAGDIDGDGLPDLVGSGDALWVALSGRRVSITNPPPLLPEARSVADFPVINEMLAANSSLPLAIDGNRNSDWVEIYNGATNAVSFTGWRMMLISRETTNVLSVTNVFFFPPDAAVAARAHQLVVFSDRLRSPYHTGFNLPAEGGTLCLVNSSGVEVNRIDYGPQQSNISLSRFRDGMPSLMACNFPTPGSANGDSGPVPPTLDFEGVDLWALQWGGPLRFFARSTDDVGVMGVTVMWNRLDIPNSPTNRLILADDGMSGDGGMLDGLYSGVLEGLPLGAEVQFYLESMDVSEITVTTPGNTAFAQAGQPVSLYSFVVGAARPGLEISEILANNKGGLRDEASGTPDWLEIRNISTNAIPLTGVALGQKFFGNSGRLAFTNVTLAPGQHYVIFADNNPAQSAQHAPFKMNRDGDQLVLTGTSANGTRVLIDTVTFGPQQANVAWARLGPEGLWRRTSPTPYAANVPRGWDLYIEPSMLVFGFATTNGFNYVVEHTDNVASTNWTALPAIRGDGLERTVTQPTGPSRFFRVRRQ